MTKKIMLMALLIGSPFLQTVNVSLAQPVNEEAVYVGAGECRQCHKDIYEGWKSTLHPYKFQQASPVNVVGDFSKNNSIEIDGKTTTMFQKNKEYFIT
ncbi:MAG: multiheme c-type cytochrome, partial [Thermodesulfobacteriota bacterium]|nr:multiheme c-type cytochrome [Thermodesulfobacteriota bacterium]